MAKGSLIGVKSGKLGDIVMYATNGKQGMRIHRDSIKNPRTPGQLQTRAKMNLAGRISKIVSKQMIAGLGQGTAGKNRNAFMKSLIKSATVSRNTANTGYIAGIAPESIIFSTGAAQMPKGISVGFGFAGAYSKNNQVEARLFYDATVTQEVMDNFAANAIVMAINVETNEFDFCTSVMLNKPTIASGSTGGYTKTYINIEGVNNHVLFAYVVPMGYNVEEASIAATSFLGTQLTAENSTQIMAELIDKGASISSMQYGSSFLKNQDEAGTMVDIMMSRLNNAFSPIDNCGELTGTYPNLAPNFSAILIPGNGAELPYSPSASLDNSNLTIGWTVNSNMKPDDKLQLAIWNSSKEQLVYVKDAASAEATDYTYQCPSTWNGDDIEVYIFFANAEGTATSESRYMGHFSL